MLSIVTFYTIDWDDARAQRLPRRQPIAHPRAERPPPRHADLCQRPAAGGLRIEEPLLRKADCRRRATIRFSTTPTKSRSSSTTTPWWSSPTGSPLCMACGPPVSEWYAPWKSIDGFEVEPNTTGSMKTLVEGLFAQRSPAAIYPRLHRLRSGQRQDHQERRASTTSSLPCGWRPKKRWRPTRAACRPTGASA